ILSENKSSKMIPKIKCIRNIEAMGSQVILYRVDVSDEEAMKFIIHEIHQKYGPINGIIHGAGVAGDGYIINRDQTFFNEVFRPKVQGTWLLDHLTKDDPIDFFVLCSSLTTVLGAPGQGDYTAANSYQDAFAFKRRRRGKKTVTINWTQWSEVGMALDYDHGNDQNGVFRPITNQKAVAAFDQVLNRNISRIFVGEINYGALAGSLKDLRLRFSTEIIKMIKNTSQLPSLDPNYPKTVHIAIKGGVEGGYTGIQKKLAQLWAEVLGLEEISLYDNFHELGGDSILATHLVRAIEPEFPGLIDVADVFSYPTIAEMADYLDKELETKSKPVVSDMAEILDKLVDGELSIDEAAVLMETAGDKIWRT
ncbi:MAG TPA: SDR family NAD(P)-dependent oxidoreductase, partial [Bacillota bacterium]|nr:SDR family NAD(P)-dependent oxidoreductase [Bacillota bacterium]